jgi:1-acyl-sn-glycerol-3-phosphate acyltransferase
MIPEGIGRYQGVVRRILRPVVHRLWRFHIEGLDNVPATGPAVLCPNHAAAIDSFLVPAVLGRNLIYVGKSEYLDDWKTRKLFPALGMIPIDRRGGDHAAAALDAARQVLERGGLFGIYPEGTRSRSGKLHKGHTGAARLAVETGAPLIPVGLIGTAEVQPVDRTLPRFFRDITIRFGRPITVDRYTSRIGDRAMYRELTDEVMYEIQQLTGLEYDPTYAGSTPPAAVPATEATSEDGPEGTIGRPSSRDLLGSTPARPLEEILAAG